MRSAAELDRCKCIGLTVLLACWHSSTEQQGMHPALKGAALHWCLVTAPFVWIPKLDRCKCIGLTMLPACWHSSTEQQGMSENCILPKAVWHCTGVRPLHTFTKSKVPHVFLQWHKAAVSLFCTATLSREHLHFAKSSVVLHWC